MTQNTTPQTVALTLTLEELQLLLDACDSHAYWQLSTEDQRWNGFVITKDDLDNEDEDDEDEDEDENAADLRAVRQLETKLEAAAATLKEDI
jgi:hypothetical protein